MEDGDSRFPGRREYGAGHGSEIIDDPEGDRRPQPFRVFRSGVAETHSAVFHGTGAGCSAGGAGRERVPAEGVFYGLKERGDIRHFSGGHVLAGSENESGSVPVKKAKPAGGAADITGGKRYREHGHLWVLCAEGPARHCQTGPELCCFAD